MKKLTVEKMIAKTVLNLPMTIPVGALVGGVQGLIGKYGLSFFNASAASAVGGFSMFAGVGAIATPLSFLSNMIKAQLIENSDFLKQHPGLKKVIKEVSDLLVEIACIAAAAAMLSLPIGPVVTCMMVLTVALKAIQLLRSAINTAIAPDVSVEPAYAM